MQQYRAKSVFAGLISKAKSRMKTCLVATALAAVYSTNMQAGTATYDFTTDPTAGGNLVVGGNGANPAPWVAAGGNPGGFLALTYPIGSSFTSIVFPDIDSGKIVSAFAFEADLRVGNSTGDRAADGFSISFARSGDPVLASMPESASAMGNWAGGIAEGGTTTGIAVDFDTWSGNTLPDSGDIEGIIVRVDNVTVLKYDMPTRHGAGTDTTSLQTGPRDPDFWTNGGDPTDANSWKTLTWQKLTVTIDDAAKLTVTWKGKTILDKYQTAYFPGPGRLVLAGRTGGANEHTHFDNIKLTTTASAADTQPPTTPGKVNVALSGARRVELNWGAATDNSGRVAYQVSRDGTKISGLLTTTNYVDLGVAPGKTYKYSVVASDIAQNLSAASEATTTTATEGPSVGFLLGQVYDNISGTAVQGLLDAESFPASPTRARYLNGLSYGEPNFGDTLGDNYGIMITGVLTAPETGSFDFFVRSDDASQFFLNTAGAAIPDPKTATPIAQEDGCCKAFQDVGNPQTTASPIALTAGKQYGFAYLVKEGGGGDWGQVAMRNVKDTTPAGSLKAIQGALLSGTADKTGAKVTITKAPANVTTPANEPVQFNVIADTFSPYTTTVIYQWYKNGSPISGATGPSYSIDAANAADNGAKFKVLIAVPGLSVTSDEATLTVNADTKKPTVFLVDGDDSLKSAVVTFSEPVDAASAGTASNYAFNNGLTVSAASVISANKVKLTTSAQTENTAYTLTVNGVKDTAGNAAAAATGTLRSFVFTLGKAKYEVWSNISGTAITALTDTDNYKANKPDSVQIVDGFAGPSNWADNYGARLSGWVVPPADSDYVFFISADDNAELWLSTDENPANKVQIAAEPTWNDPRQWVVPDRRDATNPENRSDKFTGTKWPTGNKITLKGGKKYYMEALVKEGGGGDNVGVFAKAASAADPKNGDAALGAPYEGALAPQTLPNVLSTSDTIVPSSKNSPSAEIAPNVLDGKSSTKYLNFDKLNTGVTVTPAAGASIISGITLTTANDAPERDPATWTVLGSNDGAYYEQIASGSMAAVTNRFYSRSFSFSNTKPYTSYKVVFPTVADAAKANSMQIADIGLLGVVVGAPAAKPTLAVSSAAGKVTITYTGTLQGADTVNGPYTDVAGATSPVSVTPASGARKFYRAKQ